MTRALKRVRREGEWLALSLASTAGNTSSSATLVTATYWSKLQLPGREGGMTTPTAWAQRYRHSQVDFEKSAAVGLLPALLAWWMHSRPIEGAGCAIRAVDARI